MRKQPDMVIIAGIWQSYSKYDRVIDLETVAKKDTSWFYTVIQHVFLPSPILTQCETRDHFTLRQTFLTFNIPH